MSHRYLVHWETIRWYIKVEGMTRAARHTSQKFPQTGEIIDFGNISQPGENLPTGYRLLWFKLGEYLPI